MLYLNWLFLLDQSKSYGYKTAYDETNEIKKSLETLTKNAPIAQTGIKQGHN